MNTLYQNAFTLAGINCEGPYRSTDQVKNQSGVYVILGGNGASWNKVLDVGESGDVKSRLGSHDRQNQWLAQKFPVLGAAIIYISGYAERLRIEKYLRASFNPPCGLR